MAYHFLRTASERAARLIARGKNAGMRIRRGVRGGEDGGAKRAGDISALIMSALIWLSCVITLTLDTPEMASFNFVPSQKAPVSIFSDFDFVYEDKERTRAAEDEARAKAPLFYRIEKESLTKASDSLREALEEAGKRFLMEKSGQVYKAQSGNKISTLTASLDKSFLAILGQLYENRDVRDSLIGDFEKVCEAGVISRKAREEAPSGQSVRITDSAGRVKDPRLIIKVPTPEEAAGTVAAGMSKYYSSKDRDSIRAPMAKFILGAAGDDGTLTYDAEATEERRQAAAAQIPRAIFEIKKGSPIIVKDQIVDEKTLRALEAYSEEMRARASSANFIKKLARTSVISLLMIIITGVYLKIAQPELAASARRTCLLGTVLIVSVFSNYFFVRAFQFISPAFDLPPFLASEALPLALGPVILAALLEMRAAVYAGLFVSVMAAIMLGNSFNILIQGLLLSCVTSFAVRDALNYRSFFIRIIIYVPVTLLALNAAWNWSLWTSPLYAGKIVSVCLYNGVATATLAIIMLIFLESMFDVCSNMSLLILCDYNHPLLKKLQIEALGTYHHSLMVSILAEHAAKEIGANPYKARAAALFHDIGKLDKPEYYTENNMSGSSKHDELRPRMSSLVIVNHVKEGVELARKHKLKKIIVDAIQQHHGTDLVYFFYKRAIKDAEREGESPVEELEYRYPGPLPEEKEVALVSLADACEAAARSFEKLTPAKIDSLVWELFRKRIREGQMDRANLTLAELAVVRQSFVRLLSTMLHGRVPYPREESKEDSDDDDLFVAAKRMAAARQESAEKDS
jgi:putative nucleotidyltransferase with HDIG domain